MRRWDPNRGDWVWDVRALPPTQLVIVVEGCFPRDVQDDPPTPPRQHVVLPSAAEEP